MLTNFYIYVPCAPRTLAYDIILAPPVGGRFARLRHGPKDGLWRDVQELKGVIHALKQSQDPYIILVENLARFLEHEFDDLREAIAVRSDVTWVSELTPEAFAEIEQNQPEKAKWMKQNWEIMKKPSPMPSRDWVRPAFYAVTCAVALVVVGLFLWQNRYVLFILMNQCQTELVKLHQWYASQTGNLWINVVGGLAVAAILALFGRLRSQRK